MITHILNILRNHRGRQNAITSEELVWLLAQHDIHTSQRAVRDAISEAEKEPGFPLLLCATVEGFFLAATYDEAADDLAGLWARAQAILARLEAKSKLLHTHGIHIPLDHQGRTPAERGAMGLRTGPKTPNTRRTVGQADAQYRRMTGGKEAA